MQSGLIRGPMFEILEKAIKRGKTITVYTHGHVFHGDITYLDGGIVEISESTFGDLISTIPPSRYVISPWNTCPWV